eukprot:CAMPEP_0197524226 /NCGR_PEP_ID=MMETSP1318-20131121/8953_1 /TAXON_ID=552666 /ORGANISM="Partenskyella glossopodia, Strain RCC365" /LENGTH=438 /DNA_ID=CAMNT_0043077125 /DNA_START=168 /DNA_END=1484 /DNA_ORIENTATION=+
MYKAFRAFRLDWPCLSFGVRPRTSPSAGKNVLLLTGTNANRGELNSLMLCNIFVPEVRCSNRHSESSTSSSSDDDLGTNDTDDGPDSERKITQRKQLKTELQRLENDAVLCWKHPGTVNRLQICPRNPSLVASMSDNGNVYIWDTKFVENILDDSLRRISQKKGGKKGGDSSPIQKVSLDPSFSYEGHKAEGFAVAWSPHDKGVLLTGDTSGAVRLWMPRVGYWEISEEGFEHPASVEDIQWSPSEPNVFATACCDGKVRIWDVRSPGRPKIVIDAHDTDVNVLAWNKLKSSTHLLATGADDGSFKVWDLRDLSSSKPIVDCRFHKASITSVDWHPTDESVLMVSSADHQLTIWDFSLERDEEEEELQSKIQKKNKNKKGKNYKNNKGQANVEEYPVSLYFLHQGQKDLKEAKFHSDLPGMVVATSETGFNVFRPLNL